MKAKGKKLYRFFAILCAIAFIGAIVFVASNLSNSRRERAALFEGAAVRWGKESYIPNIDVGFSSTLPEWLLELLPWRYAKIFDRVTYLNNAVGSSVAEDFEQCLVFRHVDTIVLGQVTEPDELVEVLARFPCLATVHLDSSQSYGRGNSRLKELLENQLPRITIIEMGRSDTNKPKPNKLDIATPNNPSD